jgi:hypothetical protein
MAAASATDGSHTHTSPLPTTVQSNEHQNVPTPPKNEQLDLLRKLLTNLPEQLPEASEFDFAFGQPYEDNLDDDDIRAFYHDSLAGIFGSRSNAPNTTHERRLEVYKICVSPPVLGQLSSIQRATQMDGSVLWGRGKHAVAIADDFDRVLSEIPGDGPMLQWIENLISMAQAAHVLFDNRIVRIFSALEFVFCNILLQKSLDVTKNTAQHAPTDQAVIETHDTNPYSLQPRSESKSKPKRIHPHPDDEADEILESDPDPDTEDMFDPANVPDSESDEDSILELDDTSLKTTRLKSHTAKTSAATGGYLVADANNQAPQSQKHLTTKHRVVKSVSFVGHGGGGDGSGDIADDNDCNDDGFHGSDGGDRNNSNDDDHCDDDNGDCLNDATGIDSNGDDIDVDDVPKSTPGRRFTRIEEDEILDLADDLDRHVQQSAARMKVPISRIWSALGMLYKEKRAPSVWSGFQKSFKDTRKKPHDQS